MHSYRLSTYSIMCKLKYRNHFLKKQKNVQKLIIDYSSMMELKFWMN